MVGSEMAEDGSLPARALAMVTFLYLYDAIRKLPAPPSLEAPATAAEPDPGVEVNVDSMLPIGAGLGSSAAFCVCLSASLLGGFGHVGDAKGWCGAELIWGGGLILIEGQGSPTYLWR
jgi:mevalonate kinase